MAQSCVNGARECDGCMRCQGARSKAIGNCEHCSDVIYDNENYYDFDGDLVHWECLRDWASKFEVNP